MNALALSLIPDPIRDIERAIDPLYDFRKYGLDLGLNLCEGKNRRKRESPEYRDDRLYAWEKVKTWQEKDFKRHFRVTIGGKYTIVVIAPYTYITREAS